MKRLGLLMGVLICVLAVGAGSASAFTGGGRKPSEAPLIAYGQRTLGELDNHKEDANYGSNTVAIYKLPPLSTRDQLTVDWQEAPDTDEGGFPIRMLLLQGINDFNWGEIFGDAYGCCGEPPYSVSGSGTAQTAITVQNTDSTSSYLVFYASAYRGSDEPTRLETYPYNFTVEPPRHYLGLSLGSVSKVAANGYLHATATLVTGAPAPDGSPFALTGTWSGGGVFTVGATSVGGQITFPLAMPETAFAKDVEFVATSTATSEYQAAASSKIYAEVTKPPAPPAPPKPVDLCTPATNKAHAWARIYKRRMKDAERARGHARHRLLNRAHTAERKFIAARAAKKAAC
jgi:hypothetical protein